MGLNPVLGRMAYALLFTVAVPALLCWWAQASAAAVNLPAIVAPGLGSVCAVAGSLLLILGMLALWRDGGGLPMNAFPPPRYVVRGVYAIFPHPIYLGFIGLCLGCSLWTGSASGLWLVTPCTALALWALVVGYERPDLQRRFGELIRPWLSLPQDAAAPATPGQRAATAILVFLPWLALYEAVHLLGRPPDAFTLFLPGERSHALWVWTEWLYASAYLVPLVVLAPGSARDLRRFALQGLIATAVLTLVYLVLPVISPALPGDLRGIAGAMLRQERAWSEQAVAAFPSFHVVWVFVAADVLRRRFRRLGWIALLWASAVALSCCTTGMHAVLDVVAGVAAASVFIRYERVWELLRSGAERIADSRREWRIGPLRIINHGIYAGVGAGIGVWMIGSLSGGKDAWAVLLIGFCGVAGAALWAQMVEGSPALLRPFGYYGSIFGCIGGLLLGWAGGANAVLLLGAFATAAPFIQACGRLRCLGIGIVYRHPQSRVVRFTQFSGVHLHPTQLYSLLGNLAIGALLVRLWFLAVPPPFIAGLYLILSGIARFAEEAYRGEPQTMRYGGLPVYQWLAVLCVLGGVALTTWPSAPAPVPQLGGLSLVTTAVGFGLFAGMAMGVDLPESNWRFSRLT